MKLMTLIAAAAGVLFASTAAYAGCGACGTHGDKAKAEAPKKAEAGKAACGDCNKGQKSKHAEVNTAALKALLDAKAAVTVLDARSGKYDDGRRIPGAQSLNASSTGEEIAKVLPDKAALVVTYCAGLTCPASTKLAEKLKELGYSNVVEYPEGIAGWTEAGNAVTEKK